jgi:hypothetical protein
MTKPKFIFLFFLLLFNVSVLSAQVKKIDIGLLDKKTIELGACGTTMTFAGRKSPIFNASENGTLMIIDGKLVDFMQEGSTLKVGSTIKKGIIYTDTFTSSGISLVIKFTVSGFVEDVTKYKAVITITKGKNKRVLNAEGWSAC